MRIRAVNRESLIVNRIIGTTRDLRFTIYEYCRDVAQSG